MSKRFLNCIIQIDKLVVVTHSTQTADVASLVLGTKAQTGLHPVWAFFVFWTRKIWNQYRSDGGCRSKNSIVNDSDLLKIQMLSFIRCIAKNNMLEKM